MNTKLLTEADAALHEVEMAVRRKQLAPFINELLSPEAKADCAKLAMFDSLLNALEECCEDYRSTDSAFWNRNINLVREARGIK
mgnify:CR=1 FL=1